MEKNGAIGGSTPPRRPCCGGGCPTEKAARDQAFRPVDGPARTEKEAAERDGSDVLTKAIDAAQQ